MKHYKTGEMIVKLMMDERVKHRLTGAVVILSAAVIFLPAVLKKSNQRFEESSHISLKLPEKPALPKVAIPNQKVLFESVKVAHVELPKVIEDDTAPVIAKAASLSQPKAVALVPVAVKTPTLAVKTAPVLPVKTVTTPEKKVALLIKKDLYAVQLASFTQERNAISLVARLKKEGFHAAYKKFNGKQGLFYQVTVGALDKKMHAVILQKKLAQNLQLKGLIIKTSVS